MATAAELVMAPSAARPETAGARKDALADAGETNFAEMLNGEVQAANDAEAVSDPNAAAAMQAVIAPQAQPAPAPVATSVVEMLLSLQSADTTVAQPVADAAETTLMTPAAAPAVGPVVTPEIIAAEPAPAAPALAASVPAPGMGQIEQTKNVSSGMIVEIEPVQQAAAAVAAPVVVAAVSKAVQAVAADAQGEPEAETDAAAAEPSSTDAENAARGADPAAVIATPAESSATTSATAPAQASIAMAAAPAPKPIVTTTTQSNGEKSPKVQQAAAREATAADAPAVSSKYAPPDPNASSASQTVTTGAAKPQTGVQTVAADAVPNIKTDAPAPASPSTSTSFADLLAARGAPAEAGKPATHPAMQSAPPAVAQVYTRFVERFDGRAQRFEVRLDPAELGRVDVRIEIGADKKVHAVLAAHDSAALSDLMRGQRALERALTDAGIDLKDGGLKFELANDSNRGLAGQEQRRDAWSAEEANVWRGFSTIDVPVEADVNATIAANAYPWRATRLDLVA